jgi:hypothetical protein
MQDMNFRNFIYVTTCLSFSVIIGAAVYEHIALWPNAFSEVPRSLSVFQGPYKLNPAAFWMPIHPITLGLFIITLVTTWKTQRRKNVLIPMAGYVLVLIITFLYFVPELLDLTGTPFSDVVDASRTERADRWVTLSLIRGGVLFVLAFILFFGLTKGKPKEV